MIPGNKKFWPELDQNIGREKNILTLPGASGYFPSKLKKNN